VRLSDNGPTQTEIAITLSATYWTLVPLWHTTAGGATLTDLKIIDTNAGDAQTWYCDGFQIVQDASIEVNTPWYDGNAGAQTVLYPIAGLLKTQAVSVAGWIRYDNDTKYATLKSYFGPGASTETERFLLVSETTLGSVGASLTAGSAGVLTINGTTDISDRQWHHVAATYNKNGSNPNTKLYIDGTLEASGHNTAMDPSLITLFRMAENPQQGTYLDDVRVVPYVMTAEMVAALAARTSTPYPAVAKLEVGGDIIGGTRTMLGKASRVDLYCDGAVQHRVQIELEEI
jgi:hypothetical protein